MLTEEALLQIVITFVSVSYTHLGKLGILTFPATTNQACCACIEYDAIDPMSVSYTHLNQREITDKQREVISCIVDYIASNGACTVRDIREDDATRCV